MDKEREDQQAWSIACHMTADEGSILPHIPGPSVDYVTTVAMERVLEELAEKEMAQ